MTIVKRVSRNEMVRETGVDALGYSQPQKNRILIREDLSELGHKTVLAHEVDHFIRGEEGPFLEWLIPAFVSLAGGTIASSAQNQSTQAILAGQQQAQDTLFTLYNQTRADYAPWMSTGYDALNLQRQMVGLPPFGAGGGYGGYNPGAPVSPGGENDNRGIGPDAVNEAGFPTPGPEYFFQEGGGTGYNSGGVFYDPSLIPGQTTQSGDNLGSGFPYYVQPDWYGAAGEPNSARSAGGARGIEIARAQRAQYGIKPDYYSPVTLPKGSADPGRPPDDGGYGAPPSGDDKNPEGYSTAYGPDGQWTWQTPEDRGEQVLPGVETGPDGNPAPSSYPSSTDVPSTWQGGIDPSYDWRFQEGQRALDTGASARGQMYGDRDARRNIRYGQGAASTEFQAIFNRLGALSGMGANATNASSNIAVNVGGGIAGSQMNSGDARASGYQNQGNIWTNSLYGIGNNALDAYDWFNQRPGSGSGSGSSLYNQYGYLAYDPTNP